MSSRQVQVRITGDPSRLGAAFRQSSREARGFGASLRGNVAGAAGVAAKGVAYLGAGLTIAAGVGFKKALDAAGDFEQTLNVFQATAGATGREMGLVSDAAIKLGADTKLPGTSAADAALAMTELAKGGLNVKEAMDAARGTLELSAAAQISNAEAATIVADNLNAFGLAGTDATRVADLLAASANATTASMPEMANALKMSASVAAAMGIPIEELTTELGQLANAGIKGSDAGTSVKTMLLSLAAPSNRAKQAMKDMGVAVFDANGKFRGMPAVIADFNKGLAGMSDAQRTATLKTIFGTDAIRAANIILGQSKEKHDALYDAVTKTGAASELAASQTKGWKGALGGFQSTMETIAIQIGTRALPTATRFVNYLSQNLPGAVDAVTETLGPVVSMIADLGESVAGVAGAIADADGTRAKIDVVLNVAKEQLGKLKDAVLGVDWAGVGETIGEKLGAAMAVVGDAVEGIDWGAVGETIRGKLVDALSAIGDELDRVDWDAVGSKIGSGISGGIELTQDTARRLVTALAGAVMDNRAVLADAGASLALAVVARLTDPSFWAAHWQEILSIALAVFPAGKGAVLGERLAVFLLRPFRSIGGRLAGLLVRGLESIALRVAVSAERVGGAIVNAVVRIVSASGGRLVRAMQRGLERLGPIGVWLSGRLSAAVSAADGLFRRVGLSVVTRVVNGILSAPGAVRRAGARLGGWVVSSLQNAWRSLPRLARVLIANAVVTAITNAVASAASAARRLGGRVKDGVVGGVTGVGNQVGEVIGRIPGKITALLSEVADAGSKIGGKVFSSIISGIGDIGGTIAGKVRDGVNAVLGIVDGISIPRMSISTPSFTIPLPGPIPDISVGSRSVSAGPWDLTPFGLPRLAQGGIVRARPGGVVALIGEGGRDELVEPLPPGGVLGRGGSTTYVTVNVGGSVLAERQLVDAVVMGIRSRTRREGAILAAGSVRAN